MRRQKQGRRVEVVAPTFLSVPGLIIGSNRIATLHRRLARRLSDSLPIVFRELPFDVPPIREVLQWHLTNNNDAALRWVIERIAAHAKDKDVVEGAKIVPLDPAMREAVSQELTATYRPRHKG
jgi:DNA-binding transcriptional LysR family regulator